MVVLALLFISTLILVAFGCSKKSEGKKEKKPMANPKRAQSTEVKSPPTPGATTTPTTSNDAITPAAKPKTGSKQSEALKFDLKSNHTSEQIKTNLETIEDYDNPLNDKRVQAKLRNGSATKSKESAENTQQEKSVNQTLPSTYDKKESSTVIMKNAPYAPTSRYIAN